MEFPTIDKLAKEVAEKALDEITYEGKTIREEDKIQVLDKIRAEIENHCDFAKEYHCEYCHQCCNLMSVKEILKIIDEYQEESEDDAECQ